MNTQMRASAQIPRANILASETILLHILRVLRTWNWLVMVPLLRLLDWLRLRLRLLLLVLLVLRVLLVLLVLRKISLGGGGIPVWLIRRSLLLIQLLPVLRGGGHVVLVLRQVRAWQWGSLLWRWRWQVLWLQGMVLILLRCPHDTRRRFNA